MNNGLSRFITANFLPTNRSDCMSLLGTSSVFLMCACLLGTNSVFLMGACLLGTSNVFLHGCLFVGDK